MDGDHDLIERIERELLGDPEAARGDGELVPDWQPEVPFDREPVAAAVLIGVVRRESGFSVVYTERSPQLRSHSGQVAFPGGKIDPGDRGAADAALREAAEEIDLSRGDARILGYLPAYFTGSNYLITPVVALIHPTRPFVPNPAEVKSVFEVPLEWLLDGRNYGTYRVRRNGLEHTTWQLVHNELTIWGITANLTRRFHDLAMAGKDRP